MTSLTTKQIIDYAMAWLPTQYSSTPRNLLTLLRDMSISLLAPEIPPAQPVVHGDNVFPTGVIIQYAMAWLPNQQHLTPMELLTQIRDSSISLLQQLPKWKCSMFFKGVDGHPDSALNWANISGTESNEHRLYSYDSIVRNGGDTMLFISEKLFNNTALQQQLKTELLTAYQHGIKRLIVSLKNDNNDLPWESMESYIKQMAEYYSFANDEQVAFMSCLESNEILSISQVQQMNSWCKKYAPNKRFIVGSGNSSYLKSLGSGFEKWLEIHSNPFELSQKIADEYIYNLQTFIPFQDIWAGEYWPISPWAEFISKRALEIGCTGVGSWVG